MVARGVSFRDVGPTTGITRKHGAVRLVHGVEPRTPLHECALGTCRAQLAEAGSAHAEAVMLHAAASDRWRELGDAPERAYALLGQGRCLLMLSSPDAERPLREAAEIFAAIGYRLALAETRLLRTQAVAPTS